MRLIKSKLLLETNTSWDDKAFSDLELKKRAAQFFAADILAMDEPTLATLIEVEIIHEEEKKDNHS